MITKSKNTGEKKGKIEVGKLKLEKQTVKDLTAGEKKQVKGGVKRAYSCDLTCP